MTGSWTICPLICNTRLLITPTPISKHVPWLKHSANSSPQRETASKDGQASSGSFEPSSEKAREAGRKGGSK